MPHELAERWGVRIWNRKSRFRGFNQGRVDSLPRASSIKMGLSLPSNEALFSLWSFTLLPSSVSHQAHNLVLFPSPVTVSIYFYFNPPTTFFSQSSCIVPLLVWKVYLPLKESSDLGFYIVLLLAPKNSPCAISVNWSLDINRLRVEVHLLSCEDGHAFTKHSSIIIRKPIKHRKGYKDLIEMDKVEILRAGRKSSHIPVRQIQ